MTPEDLTYVRDLLGLGVVESPCLEFGVGYGGPVLRDLFRTKGVDYFGSDMAPGFGVDYMLDLEECDPDLPKRGEWSTVMLLNVIEHTFEPLRVLDNAVKMLRPGGVCVVLAPAVWPLHDFPIDCYRFMPQFFERFAASRGLELDRSCFDYVGFGNVASFTRLSGGGEYQLPLPWGAGLRSKWARIIHRVFQTRARAVLFPSHVVVGAVLRKVR